MQKNVKRRPGKTRHEVIKEGTNSLDRERAKSFDHVKTFCMFICNRRSGHSLFGSLLDAHPDMIVAHELNALKHIRDGCTRNQLYYGLWRRSVNFTRAGRRWSGYSYKVPNQWQGRIRKLKVIGDKRGGNSVGLLKRDPGLLKRLSELVQVPVKVFHVIRNPFDNIRTMSRYGHGNRLGPAITAYFERCSTIEKIKPTVKPTDWFDVRLEALIADPKNTLRAACEFLGVTASDDYLEDCAKIIFKSPRKRRLEVDWTENQLQRVEAGIRLHPFLTGYTIDS